MRAFVGMPDGSEWIVEEARFRGGAHAAPARRGRGRAPASGVGVTVFLVGAGPGDPGLMTVRSRELIAAADVILYDRLIPPGALDGARPDAELVYVGKIGGGPQMPQEEIDRLLVQYGTGDRSVVRLKGGDPFVFGRGGEEAQVLRAAGIPFEVVPGITAGISAPAYAGIPVTHREHASGVAFVTGHEDGTLDWEALARFPGTLVFYMGVKALPRIASQLVAGGRSPDEPVAVVERGTLPGQKTVVSSLSRVVEDAAGIRAPAITLVGPVAGLREEIAWLEQRPLFGRTVAVTRARAQASALAERLRGLGASTVEAPAIRTQPLELTLPPVRDYDLLCVTSPAGADYLFTHLRDARELRGRDRRRDRAGHGAGAARARRRSRRGARAGRRRRADRGARGVRVLARARRAGARGPGRAAGRAAGAGRARGGRRAVRDGGRAAVGRGARGRRGARTTCCSRPAPPCGSSPRPAVRSPARSSSRSGPRRRTSCASSAPRRTSKPTRTRPTG